MAHGARTTANVFLQAMGMSKSTGTTLHQNAEAIRRLGKAPMENPTQAQATPPEQVHAHARTPPTRQHAEGSSSRQRATSAIEEVDTWAAAAHPDRLRRIPEGNTPWGLWSAAGKGQKDLQVSQGSLSPTMDNIKRYKLNEHLTNKQSDDFSRKAWMQIDRNSNAWVTACPKENNAPNSKQFPIVVQTYFGVAQQCLASLESQPIL
jgi:hypothetical protein